MQARVRVQRMLSLGVGREALGLPPKLEILDKAPPPCWNLQARWWKVSKGAPQCWGSACLACPASLGLLATTQHLPPALASSCSLASSLCRKTRSISLAESREDHRRGRRGWGTGSQGVRREAGRKAEGLSQGRGRGEWGENSRTWEAKEGREEEPETSCRKCSFRDRRGKRRGGGGGE